MIFGGCGALIFVIDAQVTNHNLHVNDNIFYVLAVIVFLFECLSLHKLIFKRLGPFNLQF